MGLGVALVLTMASVTAAVDDRSPTPTDVPASLLSRLVTEEVEPGVLRILHDGYRDLSGAAMTELPETYAGYRATAPQ